MRCQRCFLVESFAAFRDTRIFSKYGRKMRKLMPHNGAREENLTSGVLAFNWTISNTNVSVFIAWWRDGMTRLYYGPPSPSLPVPRRSRSSIFPFAVIWSQYSHDAMVRHGPWTICVSEFIFDNFFTLLSFLSLRFNTKFSETIWKKFF